MEWISVEDRLPEIDVPVLGTQHLYLDINKNRYYKVIRFMGLDENLVSYWVDDGDDENTYSPTHWMPLPEPPKS